MSLQCHSEVPGVLLYYVLEQAGWKHNVWMAALVGFAHGEGFAPEAKLAPATTTAISPLVIKLHGQELWGFLSSSLLMAITAYHS